MSVSSDNRSQKKRARRRLVTWRLKQVAKLARKVERFREYVERQEYMLASMLPQWLEARRLDIEWVDIEQLLEFIVAFGDRAPMMIQRDFPIVGEEPGSADQALDPAVDSIATELMRSRRLQRAVDPEKLKTRLKDVARNGNGGVDLMFPDVGTMHASGTMRAHGVGFMTTP